MSNRMQHDRLDQRGNAPHGPALQAVRRLDEAEAAARALPPLGAARATTLRLRPCREPRGTTEVTHGLLHCGGHSAALQLLASTALDADGITPAELLNLDDTLRQNLLQELLAPITGAIVQALDQPVTLDTQHAHYTPSADAEVLDVALADDNALALRLRYAPPAAAVWRRCGGIVPDARSRQALRRLPVPCVLRFAQLTLAWRECRALVPGGALVLPRAADSSDAVLCDRRGRRWARVLLESQLVRITEVLVMDQHPTRLAGAPRARAGTITPDRTPASSAAGAADALPEVDVELTVEAPAEPLSIEQLTQLAPGQLVGLTPEAARGLVLLRANGVALARGRLVAVGESLAVYIDDVLDSEAH